MRRAAARTGVLGIALEIVHEAGLGLAPVRSQAAERRVVGPASTPASVGEVGVGVKTEMSAAAVVARRAGTPVAVEVAVERRRARALPAVEPALGELPRAAPRRGR